MITTNRGQLVATIARADDRSLVLGPRIAAQHDRVDHALWTTWQPSAIPCFTIELLRELRAASTEIERRFSSATISPLRYVIIRSAVANVFNLGGDLAYFARLIEAQDEAGLAEYANLAVDVTFRNYTGHNLPNVTTIALLEGDALGGGLESALSCDLVIAEKHVKAGFPEVLFNMFPGMGGLSFLARRTSRQIVNEVTRSGRLYSAQELYDFGIVDMVVESGEAVTAARRLLRQRYQQHEAHTAMNVVDRLIRPVSRDELDDVVRLWVDSALRLTSRGLEWMRRLHKQQTLAFARKPTLPIAAAAPSSIAA
jgi:DSF synthase